MEFFHGTGMNINYKIISKIANFIDPIILNSKSKYIIYLDDGTIYK